MTAVMLAASNGHDSVVKLLAQHGANVNAQNKVCPSVRLSVSLFFFFLLIFCRLSACLSASYSVALPRPGAE